MCNGKRIKNKLSNRLKSFDEIILNFKQYLISVWVARNKSNISFQRNHEESTGVKILKFNYLKSVRLQSLKNREKRT